MMSVLAMVVALPAMPAAPVALASAQAGHAPAPGTGACGWESPQPEPDDPRWRWRLRAYRHLDCVMTLVDRALKTGTAAPNGKDDTVPVSRAELEQIRTLAWWARDAAGRIGQ
jgi:hypothetical protein